MLITSPSQSCCQCRIWFPDDSGHTAVLNRILAHSPTSLITLNLKMMLNASIMRVDEQNIFIQPQINTSPCTAHNLINGAITITLNEVWSMIRCTKISLQNHFAIHTKSGSWFITLYMVENLTSRNLTWLMQWCRIFKLFETIWIPASRQLKYSFFFT